MEKEINGHLYITNDNLKRIADALEEILRLVKKDMEPRIKEKDMEPRIKIKEKDEVYIETLNGPELREKN